MPPLKWFDEAEQTKMNDCYFDKKDWRTCKKEVSVSCSISLSFHRRASIIQPCQIRDFLLIRLECMQMEIFRECWKRQGNDQRTETKDA